MDASEGLIWMTVFTCIINIYCRTDMWTKIYFRANGEGVWGWMGQGGGLGEGGGGGRAL